MLYAEQLYTEWYVDWENSGFSEVIEIPFWIQLHVDLKEAEAEGERRCLQVIRDAAVGQDEITEHSTTYVKGEVVQEIQKTKQQAPKWQAAAWLLERRFPDQYGRRKAFDGELPPGLDYETVLLAKALQALPKSDLEQIKQIVKDHMGPRLIASGGEELQEVENRQ